MDQEVSFGTWVSRRRKTLGLSRVELARRSACATVTLRKIEEDARRPSPELAALLADRLAIPAAERAAFVRAARRQLTVDQLPAANELPFVTPRPRIVLLPTPLTPLVGRDADVAAVGAHLRDGDMRLLTLLGPPGIGKTRLSLAVATALQNAFADGVCFVPLASLSDPVLVLPAIAQALGLVEDVRTSAAAQLSAFLRDQRVLLVLDNCEHLVAAAPDLAALLAAAPWLHILATSRVALRIAGEQRYLVPPLQLPMADETSAVIWHTAAVELFVQRARAVLPSFTMTERDVVDVAAICRRLDGLPLAIELAAARITLFSPSALLARLEWRLALLTAGAADVPVRQQTLRGAIAWSYHLLSPPDQALFRHLGVFVGGCTLEAVEHVCSMASAASPVVVAGVASLIDQSMLQRDGAARTPRFMMLETLREYALEQMEVIGEAASLRRRHTEYFLGLAQQAASKITGLDHAVWLGVLEAEQNNLRSALDWGMNNPADRQLGVQLAVVLGPFWQIRGQLDEGRQWLAKACSLVEDEGATALAARAFHLAGLLAFEQDDRAQAQIFLERSLDLHQQRGDELGMAASLTGLARADVPRGLALHTHALALWRKHTDRRGTASSLSYLARLAFENGQAMRALEQYDEALALYRQCEDIKGVADVLAGRSEALHAQGDLEQACTVRLESLTLCRQLGYKPGIAWSLFNLARFACDQGDYARTHALCQESSTLFQELGNPWGFAWSLYTEGIAEQRQAAYARASEYFAQSLAMFRSSGDPAGIAACRAGLDECQSALHQMQTSADEHGLRSS